MTALVVKVISMIAERQQMVIGQHRRTARVVPFEQIQHSVGYLLSVQQDNGSFGDPHPVLHKGVMVFKTIYIKHTPHKLVTCVVTATRLSLYVLFQSEGDRKASMTAFVTIALYRSIGLLHQRRAEVVSSFSSVTLFLPL